MPIFQPLSLRRTGRYPWETAEATDVLAVQCPDAMVAATYGLILSQEVLGPPRLGCINVHASLLPHWCGAVLIHRVVGVDGAEPGTMLMRMDTGLGTGGMITMERVPIDLTDTADTLRDTLAALDGRVTAEVLAKLVQYNKLHATSQSAEGITHAGKIAKDEAALDWSRHVATLLRQTYVSNPSPGASAVLDSAAIKFRQAEVLADRPAEAKPGTVSVVSAEGVTTACSAGALRMTQLQKPGGKRPPAREFLQSLAIQPGQRLALRG